MKIPEGLKLVALDDGGVMGYCAHIDAWGRRAELKNALHLWEPSAQEFVYAIKSAQKNGPKMVIAYVRNSEALSFMGIDRHGNA